MIELFEIYRYEGCKDLCIPIKIIYTSEHLQIFVYKYKDFTKKWKLSDILYENKDDFEIHTVKYSGKINYFELFECIFTFGNKTEYGDII